MIENNSMVILSCEDIVKKGKYLSTAVKGEISSSFALLLSRTRISSYLTTDWERLIYCKWLSAMRISPWTLSASSSMAFYHDRKSHISTRTWKVYLKEPQGKNIAKSLEYKEEKWQALFSFYVIGLLLLISFSMFWYKFRSSELWIRYRAYLLSLNTFLFGNFHQSLTHLLNK